MPERGVKHQTPKQQQINSSNYNILACHSQVRDFLTPKSPTTQKWPTGLVWPRASKRFAVRTPPPPPQKKKKKKKKREKKTPPPPPPPASPKARSRGVWGAVGTWHTEPAQPPRRIRERRNLRIRLRPGAIDVTTLILRGSCWEGGPLKVPAFSFLGGSSKKDAPMYGFEDQFDM